MPPSSLMTRAVRTAATSSCSASQLVSSDQIGSGSDSVVRVMPLFLPGQGSGGQRRGRWRGCPRRGATVLGGAGSTAAKIGEHTSELQSRRDIVCRLLL